MVYYYKNHLGLLCLHIDHDILTCLVVTWSGYEYSMSKHSGRNLLNKTKLLVFWRNNKLNNVYVL